MKLVKYCKDKLQLFARIMSQTLKIFAKHLSSKLEEDDLNDCIFSFNDEKDENETTIKANRGLLSVLSPVFKSMFKNGMKESLDNDAIPIKDVDSKSFKLFIQYFYGMDPQITSSNIGPLSYLAQKYLVDGLQQICTVFLTESISVTDIIPILHSLYQYHQDKLVEICKVWMTKQTSTDEIIGLFESDKFMTAHHNIVNVLLSGFGTVIDTKILWKCVLKWSEANTKQEAAMPDIHDDDQKDDEKKNELQNDENQLKHNKLMLIRKHFPFYLLPIHIICSQVLPLKLLTQEMSLEILSHQTHGYQQQLAQYCISHEPSLYPSPAPKPPPPSTFFKSQFMENALNNTVYGMGCTVKCNAEGIIYGKHKMVSGNIYTWSIYLHEYKPNPWIGFGIDVVNDQRKSSTASPGEYSKNSYGIYIDANNFWLYANGKKMHEISKGVKTGVTIIFKYDAIEGTLNVVANEQQKYTFSGIDVTQTFHASFRSRADKLTFIVSDVKVQ